MAINTWRKRPGAGCSTLALIPAFSPGKKENGSPLHSNTCAWIGRVVIKLSAPGRELFPLLGESDRVREVVPHSLIRIH